MRLCSAEVVASAAEYALRSNAQMISSILQKHTGSDNASLDMISLISANEV